MDTRNDSTLIPIPSIVDDARWIGRFSREVRKSITALRDRRQVMTKLPNLNYLHPFKLFTLDTATAIISRSSFDSPDGASIRSL